MNKTLQKIANLATFNNFKVRRSWLSKQEKWVFAVIDIVAILIEQEDYNKSKTYWKVLKHRLAKEGSELVTNCNQLKIKAQDGKMLLVLFMCLKIKRY